MNIRLIFALLSLLTLFALAWTLTTYGFTPASWPLIGTLAALGVMASLLYTRIVRQARVVGMGMDLLREQDYASRLAPVGQPDADKIVELFNDLMSRLKAEKLRVREQNHFLDLLIEASPMGIVSLDAEERVNLCNPMAVRLLGADPMGNKLGSLSSPLAQVCARLKPDTTTTVRLGDTMIYRCSRTRFMDRGVPRPFLLIETLTDEVRRAEREAYGKVIRVIGHEVNNSMASIGSLLQLLLELRPWGEEEEMQRAVEGCAHRASLLGEFISAYTRVVKIPEPVLTDCSLAELIRSMQPFLTSMASAHGCSLEFDIRPEADERIRLDMALMEQALINIVKNSLESGAHRVTITLSDAKTMTVADDGSGISPEASQRLFTPFFSTKPSGQGLGLMFVAEILRRHGARFSLLTEDGVTRFTIRM